MPTLKDKYKKEVIPELMKKFSYTNVMQVPKVSKIVLNIGLGEALTNPKAMESAQKDLGAITGQHPVVTKSKKSIAAFKLRQGQDIGVMVTLRGIQMYEFFDRLVNVVLPRIRDFQGVPRESFDGKGNYALGFKEQLMFPEIEYDKVEKVRGLSIVIVTTAQTDEEGRELLAAFGMPFKKN
jgi:large subunit ribosomal protein L5